MQLKMMQATLKNWGLVVDTPGGVQIINQYT